jgi:transcriptional regulator with XRE-family HTH domain
MTSRFNIEGFAAAVDYTRRARGMTRLELATATGISAAGITRLSHGAAPAAPGLAALCAWAGLDLREFHIGPAGAPLPEPITVALMALNADGRLPAVARAMLTTVMLTTYQQLTAIHAAA